MTTITTAVIAKRWVCCDYMSAVDVGELVTLVPGADRLIDDLTALHFDGDKFVMTQDHGLVILGALERNSGLYVCQLGREAVSSHRVSVDAHRCAAPGKTADYQRAYSQWCSEYQKYRSALKSWEERQNKCASAEAIFNQQNQVYKTSPFV